MVELKNNIIKDLNIYNKFVNIVLNNEVKHYKLSNKYSKSQIKGYIKEYLKYYDTNYYESFLDLNKSKRLIYNKGVNDIFIKSKNKIYLNYRGNIDDALGFIHEFMHYINYNYNPSSIDSPLREVPSIINEFILSDYLYSKQGLDDSKKQLSNNMFNYKKMSNKAKLDRELYDLSGDDTKSITEEQKVRLADIIYSTDKINLDYYSYYLIGLLLSIHIHQNIKDLEELKNICNLVMKEDYTKLKGILGIDFNIDNEEFNISQDSIKVLEKSYKCEVDKYE